MTEIGLILLIPYSIVLIRKYVKDLFRKQEVYRYEAPEG